MWCVLLSIHILYGCLCVCVCVCVCVSVWYVLLSIHILYAYHWIKQKYMHGCIAHVVRLAVLHVGVVPVSSCRLTSMFPYCELPIVINRANLRDH